MEPGNVHSDELQRAITQLDQAIHMHTDWYKNVLRVITCHLQPDQQDLTEDSFKQCNLGQWYYNYSLPELHKHPGFKALGDAHEYMHKLATEILQINQSNELLSTYDFDKFENAVERMQLEITSLKSELEASLYKRDPLTGAINRLDMLPILEELQAINRQKQLNSAIIMLDIDRFKDINEKHGHAAADKVLETVCTYLIQNIRGYDKIFRYGGDEFLICIANVDAITAYDKIEELRKGIAKLPIQIDATKTINVTISCGIVLLDHYLSIQNNIERVDQAVASAKRAGRNCVVVLEDGQGPIV